MLFDTYNNKLKATKNVMFRINFTTVKYIEKYSSDCLLEFLIIISSFGFLGLKHINSLTYKLCIC